LSLLAHCPTDESNPEDELSLRDLPAGAYWGLSHGVRIFPTSEIKLGFEVPQRAKNLEKHPVFAHLKSQI
jgi:hypothetical protein